jgi:hypothetical protein
MKAKTAPQPYVLTDGDDVSETGYVAYKKQKIERGLEQVKVRSTLIPADQVWRNLGLER